MDGLDGLSIVCPSPRYRNSSTGFRYTRGNGFRYIVGNGFRYIVHSQRLAGFPIGIGTFLSSFRQDWLSIGLSDFPRQSPLGYIHSQVRVRLSRVV